MDGAVETDRDIRATHPRKGLREYQNPEFVVLSVNVPMAESFRNLTFRLSSNWSAEPAAELWCNHAVPIVDSDDINPLNRAK